MEEKLKKANKLNENISNIKSFLQHIERSQGFYQGNEEKENYSDKLSLRSFIYTGEDNPQYEIPLYDKDTIKVFINAGKSVLEEILKNKTEELDSIIK